MRGDDKAKQLIREIADKIRRHYQPEKIILFGSYAYGNPDRGSDIDLLIVKGVAERPIDRRVAIHRIVDLREPIGLSPLVVTPDELEERLALGDQFLQEIVQKGEVLYARG
jgi:predicted nucleotidyltransferase